MKVRFNRAAFQDALSLATSIIPNRTPKEILRCLRITAEQDSVSLRATDAEVGVNCRVTQVEVMAEGDIVVPADKIAAIVREGVDDVIELEAAETTVHLRGADSHFTIYGHDPSQFPDVPDGFEGEPDCRIDLDKLQEGVGQTVFAAARESTRYALNGILWEVVGKKLTLVATDGRRLARSTVTLQSEGAKLPEGRVIVPAKTMQLLDRIVGDESAVVAIRFVKNQIVLDCGQAVVSSNLVEGNFPKYEDIIPKDCDKKLTLGTEAMLSAVRRAALLANEESKGIKVRLDKGMMVLTSRAPETGDAQVDMAIEYEGVPIEIGFNPQFLIDVLRVIRAESFELHLGQADRPGMIKSGNNFLYIVMPVNL